MTAETFTIIEPGIEFIPPRVPYLQLIELAARTCHKSEEFIKEKSAERLLEKIVFKKGHESVIEHANCIMKVEASTEAAKSQLWDILGIGEFDRTMSRILFGGRVSMQPTGYLISGNVRMWRDLDRELFSTNLRWGYFRAALHEKWPFFFEEFCDTVPTPSPHVRIVGENPLTNRDGLSPEEMGRHMTLTYRFIGDRAMSHQLVRHRFAAYSQESQRYCNYGKKGFQFIVPPSISDPFIGQPLKDYYLETMNKGYHFYNLALGAGINPEDARRPLGNATKTEVFTTLTLEMWNHFHKMRTLNDHAEWCIKGLGEKVFEHQKTLLPEVFDA